MKKTYTKPAATFESFVLSANISAGCAQMSGVNTNSGDSNSCGFTQNGYPVYLFVSAGCDYTPSEKDVADLCYDIPFDVNRIFGS